MEAWRLTTPHASASPPLLYCSCSSIHLPLTLMDYVSHGAPAGSSTNPGATVFKHTRLLFISGDNWRGVNTPLGNPGINESEVLESWNGWIRGLRSGLCCHQMLEPLIYSDNLGFHRVYHLKSEALSSSFNKVVNCVGASPIKTGRGSIKASAGFSGTSL